MSATGSGFLFPTGNLKAPISIIPVLAATSRVPVDPLVEVWTRQQQLRQLYTAATAEGAGLVGASLDNGTATAFVGRALGAGGGALGGGAHPLVCLVIPFRNADAAQFGEALDSALAQTLANLRVIVVDDFSTAPASLDALAAAPGRDPLGRIDVVHARALVGHLAAPANETLAEAARYGSVGLGAVRQASLAACEARGDAPFVLFLDADDQLHPTAAEKFVYYLNAHPDAHFVSSWIAGFGDAHYIHTKGFEWGWRFRDNNEACAMAMHRSASLRRVGHSTRREGMEDWATWLRYADAGLWGATVQEALVRYRRRAPRGQDDARWDLSARAKEHFKETQVPRRLLDNDAWPALPAVRGSAFSLAPPALLPVGAMPNAADRWPAGAAQAHAGATRRMQRQLMQSAAALSLAAQMLPAADAQLQLSEVAAASGETAAAAGGGGGRSGDGSDAAPRAAPTGMRMLLLLPWLTLGGADRFNLDLCRHLAAYGWRLTIATTLPSANPWAAEFQAITSDIFFLPLLAPPSGFLQIVYNLAVWRRVQVVYNSNSLHGYWMTPFLAHALPRTVFVDMNHMEEDGWRNGGHTRNSVALQPLQDQTYVSSQHLRRWMAARGANASRIAVRYTGVDLAAWPGEAATAAARAAYRAELGIPADAFVVLYAARLDAQKQPLLFARVAARLLEASAHGDTPAAAARAALAAAAVTGRTHVVVAGSGPLQERTLAALDEIPQPLRGSNVHVVGALAPAAVPRALAAADVLLLPSTMEGIPLIFFEAMAAGCVIVGADVGGSAELVTHRQTGFLLRVAGQPADSDLGGGALAAGVATAPMTETEQVEGYVSILSLLRADRPLLAQMSAAARGAVLAFSQAETFAAIDSDLRAHVARKTHPQYRPPLRFRGGLGTAQPRTDNPLSALDDGAPRGEGRSGGGDSEGEGELLLLRAVDVAGTAAAPLAALADSYRWAVKAEHGEVVGHLMGLDGN